MYVSLGASPSTQAALLPSCYSQELDDCVMERNLEYPRCDEIQRAYESDFDAMESAINVLPYCSEKTRYYWAAAGAGVGLVLASLIWTAVG